MGVCADCRFVICRSASHAVPRGAGPRRCASTLYLCVLKSINRRGTMFLLTRVRFALGSWASEICSCAYSLRAAYHETPGPDGS